MQRLKRQATEWENTFAVHLTDDLCRIYKELLHNNKKETEQINRKMSERLEQEQINKKMSKRLEQALHKRTFRQPKNI